MSQKPGFCLSKDSGTLKSCQASIVNCRLLQTFAVNCQLRGRARGHRPYLSTINYQLSTINY
ncbi:MAG: hypothetical protein ACRC62_19955 [Microcoleus sp.]